MAAELIIYPPDQQGVAPGALRRRRPRGRTPPGRHPCLPRRRASRAASPRGGPENTEDVHLTNPDFVEWRGAGPEACDPFSLSILPPAEMLLCTEPRLRRAWLELR